MFYLGSFQISTAYFDITSAWEDQGLSLNSKVSEYEQN